jgi:hypothetical protein
MRSLLFLLLAGVTTVACGKEGPPLAPLRLVPEAPANVTLMRMADEVSLAFTVPSTHAAGAPGPADIERVEVYAVSLAPGAAAPPNREFLTPKYLVGAVPVRPLPVEGAPAPDPAVKDPRPAPGEPARFVETLTPAALTPAPAKVAPAPAVVYTRGQIPSVPVVPDIFTPKQPVRIYVVRAVSRRGAAGNPSTRLQMPLVDPPPRVPAVTVSFTAASITVAWTAPGQPPGPSLLYNVYKADAPSGPPLNPAPLAALAFERPGVTFGLEECFVVRSVQMFTGIAVVSGAGAQPGCVTPRDVFPPAAPSGLSGVSSGGVVALIWDPTPDADLAGYLVLRAEAPGETLRPITAAPITDTAYRDTAVVPGVRYVYAIVAVDRASPPNMSAQSARVEVTAAQ